MGCIFDTWETPYCVRKVLEKQFAAHQEQQLIENGRDTYAGHIGRATGLNIVNKQFTDRQEAYAWLDDHAVKWEEAVAVVFCVGPEPTTWIVGANCAS